MIRALSKVVATVAITSALAWCPAIASAGSIEGPAVAQPVIGGAPTPPFDPVCPLCFIREALESLSAK